MQSKITHLGSGTWKWTGATVKNQSFGKSLWGFAKEEVTLFLDDLSRFLDRMLAQEKEQNERVQALTIDLQKWKSREAELEQLREKALQEADSIRARAREEARVLLEETEVRANEIRQRTETWLESVLNEVQETDRRREHFRLAFRSALDSHYEILNQESQLAVPVGERLHSFLKSLQESEKHGPQRQELSPTVSASVRNQEANLL